jgi:hypothetical protein
MELNKLAMKRFLIASLIMAGSKLSFGQTFAEWFNQKKTYRKYNAQNIVNNQIYLEVLKKGYGIYQDGTNTWHNVKNGEFGQHTTYFNSLKAVSPGVAKYPKIKGCGDFQSSIMREYTKGKKVFSSHKSLSPKEKQYIEGVYSNLLEECSKSMDELEMVVTSNKVEMSDDERIKVIDKVYAGYQDKFSFIMYFNNSTMGLCRARMQAVGDIGAVKGLYGN